MRQMTSQILSSANNNEVEYSVEIQQQLLTTISIVIPVFNEASTVEDLLERVWQQPLSKVKKEIVIIESNSTDESRNIVCKFVDEKNRLWPGSCKLILQERARGKGFAMREGFVAATGDIILIQDADLEYDVADYPILIEPILQGKAEFVLGSRHLSAGHWKIRHFESNRLKAAFMNFGGVFFHGLFNLTFHQELTDPTTMYKVFKRDCLKDLHFECNRFDFDFELLGKLIRAGFIPIEVPVSYQSRSFKDGKKVRIFRDPFTWIKAIIKTRFSPLYEPNHEDRKSDVTS